MEIYFGSTGSYYLKMRFVILFTYFAMFMNFVFCENVWSNSKHKHNNGPVNPVCFLEERQNDFKPQDKVHSWISCKDHHHELALDLQSESVQCAADDTKLFKDDWRGSETSNIVPIGPCNIPRISAKELNQRSFLNEFAYQKPVVLLGASNNEEFQELTTYKNLNENYGHTTVKLSSANSYSYEKRVISFEEYINNYLEPQSLKTFANETFYFFGDNNNDQWFDLLNKYKYPLYSLPNHLPQYSFGVAGPGSGVPFHFHGPGFAETLWGRKRWFMYPPSVSPKFHPNRTTLQWLHEEYPKVKGNPDLYECTLSPLELIYFPDHWWHATLNVDTSVFMSTFLSP